MCALSPYLTHFLGGCSDGGSCMLHALWAHVCMCTCQSPCHCLLGSERQGMTLKTKKYEEDALACAPCALTPIYVEIFYTEEGSVRSG